MSDARLQVVLVLPGGQFLGLGLIEVANVDVLMGALASRDERGGHSISPRAVRHAYDQAKAAQSALEEGRQARGLNNDADADGA